MVYTTDTTKNNLVSGPALRLCLPDVQTFGEQAEPEDNNGHYNRCGGDRGGVSDGRTSCIAHRHE